VTPGRTLSSTPASFSQRCRNETAYSTAKFAVRGFSEALIEDLRVNAPHVRVAVVMPGHVGTDIIASSLRARRQPSGPVNDPG
jgi:NAD(P)-dependent dehydrogenase (short-subunit alcohol dehydrogenase family)